MEANQTLRTRLLQVEQHVKEIGGDLQRSVWQLQELSKEETNELRRLLEQRRSLLNDMMQPTAAEVKRLEQQNGRLLQLYRELCANVHWAGGFQRVMSEGEPSSHTRPCHTEGILFYEYDLFGDEPSVLSLSEDDYYGSDFAYMMQLMTSWKDDLCKLATVCAPHVPPTNDTTWADGILFHPAFQHINICYPLHVACCHLLYSVPDVLRMNRFERRVDMQLLCESFMTDEYMEKGGEG